MVYLFARIGAALAMKVEAHIDVTTHAGLRDRALIGLMVYSFARIGAALAMKVEATGCCAGDTGSAKGERPVDSWPPAPRTAAVSLCF